MSANEPKVPKMKAAEAERDSAAAYLELCRENIKKAMAEEKRAFNLWYRAEQKFTKLEVELKLQAPNEKPES